MNSVGGTGDRLRVAGAALLPGNFRTVDIALAEDMPCSYRFRALRNPLFLIYEQTGKQPFFLLEKAVEDFVHVIENADEGVRLASLAPHPECGNGGDVILYAGGNEFRHFNG